MKLCSFSTADNAVVRPGVYLSESSQVVDITATIPSLTSVKDILGNPEHINAVKAIDNSKAIALAAVKLHAPISNPSKIFAMGLNYADHAKEAGLPLPTSPFFAAKFPNTITGCTDDVLLPPTDMTVEADWEVELVAVIGTGGKNIKKEDAYKHIAGYMVAQDISARDWCQQEKARGQWSVGKSFDNFAPCGPFIALSDEVTDPHCMPIKCWVNDQLMQNSNTNDLVFKCDYLVQFLSSICTLEAGDLIFTGTPSGVGMGMKPTVYLKEGDVIKSEIENLGTMTNKCRQL
eukprot:GFYU01022723.1.p1 GENE.GFYU01022723.1~~GFYU01022723.1.p1  ORF type:complete len:290 (-),score=96.09 GFYU01022723.1:54-923(-)